MAIKKEDIEKEMFEMVTKNDIINLQMLLSKIEKVDIYDENGMTPLQHASYKGHKEIVQILIDQGADVNSSKHEHKYTALHFAALSGNIDICLLLLLAGAKTDQINTVSRTASQMAAFVGNHECVVIINNFISKSNIEYYYNQIEPPLINDFNLIEPLHKFIININIHPIRILINLKNSIQLLNNIENIIKILKLMCKNEMNNNKKNSNSNNNNEILSFKYHYLYYILNDLYINYNKNKNNKTINDIIELYIRKLIKNNKNNNNEYIDNLIKDCIREFEFRESTIFRELITSLSTSTSSSASNNISTLNILICIINGQQYYFNINNNCCFTCNEPRPTKKCSKCKIVQYCDRECQRLHWFLHKKICMRTTISKSNNTTSATKSLTATHLSNTNNVVDTSEITSEIQNIIFK